MAKKDKSTKKDYISTIGDDEKVADLDNDSGQAMELNPDFTFDADGLDIGGEEDDDEEEDLHSEDQLDAILRRHGGLDANKSNVSAEPESDQEDSEEESENEESGNDEDGEEKSDEDKAEETSASKPTIATDKSGFFEDAPDVSTSIPFAAMNLSRPVLKGISEANYTSPTPIQSAVIPVGLLGKDIVAGAVTGSGKTAAYLIPTLERLVYRPTKSAATRVVVLTPTRELAMQVFEVGQQLGRFIPNLTFGLAVGGLSLRAQEQQLRSKPDVVVATPGRFIDHVRNSPSFNVDDVEVLVLDEADRMLEEGFEAEVTEILKLIPAKRQTLLFSATMNNSIQDLVKLSLKKPVRLMLNPPKQAAKGLVQEFVRIRKQHDANRPAILVSLLRKLLAGQHSMKRVIVFVSQKRLAHKLRVICGLLGIRVGELHGSLTQDQRITSINQFKSLEVPVLICTDLASRGLDIPKIEVVINYELPSTYDVYLHRIGRTARAGRSGTAISFVGESNAERQLVKSAISASSGAKQKILGRNVNWDEVKLISEEINSKEEVIEEVLEEEKTVKELGTAEKELERAENLVAHRDEIKARPKRTWFESAADKNDLSRKRRKQLAAPKSNSQKKKLDKNRNAAEGAWAYKKTKGDRKLTSQRGSNKSIMTKGARELKN